MIYILNTLYCNSYHKFSNICKPEEGWYGQPKYCYEKNKTRCYDQLCSGLWTSSFLDILAD